MLEHIPPRTLISTALWALTGADERGYRLDDDSDETLREGTWGAGGVVRDDGPWLSGRLSSERRRRSRWWLTHPCLNGCVEVGSGGRFGS